MEPEVKGQVDGPAQSLKLLHPHPCPLDPQPGMRAVCLPRQGPARPARGTQASKEPGCQQRGQAGARRACCSKSAHLPQVRSQPRNAGRPCQPGTPRQGPDLVPAPCPRGPGWEAEHAFHPAIPHPGVSPAGVSTRVPPKQAGLSSGTLLVAAPEAPEPVTVCPEGPAEGLGP